ncbi:SAM-dependent methyltransferase [Amycolatopsis rhabdoformis]|uniref:SAM-dependent methyltransferase n=1 Tax=Amycolatopsis rhabdoformis TaxID=1448059 RepID=A0ABZ1HYZ0_9PSEU|nr:SAM-dependent methyltransferase [Amycolatopsis rhabdoformis]WSE27404.1 SAM-dependent methyltransferase [Amycolatopsis rhabdoformis]
MTYSPGGAPVGIDPTMPSTARVYDAALGGKDNYAADRELLDRMIRDVPEVIEMARMNRAFLIRACRFLADNAGIRQFIDCGSGLPTAENVHQVVQRVNNDATVVYTDNDPTVLAHGRVLLLDNEQTHIIGANVFHPAEVLDNPEVRGAIDFTQPVALLHLADLHFYPDDPAELMARYLDALPSGSFVVVSHCMDPENEHSHVARKFEEIYKASSGSPLFRTRAEIERILPPTMELITPGWVIPGEWWPDGPTLKQWTAGEQCVLAAVARKP